MTDHAELIEPSPVDRGEFVGDIFYGDPTNSTRGTHRWTGAAWEALPTDAEVLTLMLAEARARVDALVAERDALAAEVAKLRTPEWFYNADDGEYTYGDVSDTVENMGHDGVMRVGGAREVWKKWVAVRCVALDVAGDVDETEVMTFDSEDEALRCWPESLARARAALAQSGE